MMLCVNHIIVMFLFSDLLMQIDLKVTNVFYLWMYEERRSRICERRSVRLLSQENDEKSCVTLQWYKCFCFYYAISYNYVEFRETRMSHAHGKWEAKLKRTPKYD